MKKKIAIIGHFGGNNHFTDGQTVKTVNLYNELRKATSWNIIKIDTFYKSKHPFLLFVKVIKTLLTTKDIIILLSAGGMKFFFPLLSFSAHFLRTKVYHDVIGGNLAELVKENPKFRYYLNSFKKNWVETNLLKNELEELGIVNADIIPNFRRLKTADIAGLPKEYNPPFRFCTFSRVIAEKGIGEAIRAVVSVNNQFNHEVCKLDIYGPIGEAYKKEFEDLLRTAPSSIRYCGEVPNEKAVEILKNYAALIFPTRWDGESQAGTLSESCLALLPAIATDWRCNKEMIKDGYNGFLYPGSYAQTLEGALLYFISHKDSIFQMRQNCLEMSKYYEPDAYITKIIKSIEAF